MSKQYNGIRVCRNGCKITLNNDLIVDNVKIENE